MKNHATRHRLSSMGMLFLTFAGSAWGGVDEDTTLSTLKHNPFAVPAIINESTPVQSVDTVQQELSVRAVLISEAGILININGSILGLHEFVDGYELISLDRDKAVLLKDGEELVLTFPNRSNIDGLGRQQYSTLTQ